MGDMRTADIIVASGGMAGVSSGTMNVQLTSKNILTLDELEFYELSQLAGVTMEPATFKIILDLLKMNVSPQAVLQMLKTMCSGKRKKSDREGEGSMPPPRPRASSRNRNLSGSGSGSSSRRQEKR